MFPRSAPPAPRWPAGRLVVLGLLALTSCGRPVPGPLVFGAASLRHAVERCLTAAAPTLRASWGSTSTLVHQVRQGAHADLVLSAHPDWTRALAELQSAPTVPIARNRLVLAAPAHGPAPSLAQLDDAACVVLADPDHVPLGRYARAALEAAGAWDRVAPKVVATLDASAAAMTLAAGRCDIGVLYATDAGRAGLRAADDLPASWQPDIRYDAIPLTPEGARLVEALTSSPCQAALRQARFVPVGSP